MREDRGGRCGLDTCDEEAPFMGFDGGGCWESVSPELNIRGPRLVGVGTAAAAACPFAAGTPCVEFREGARIVWDCRRYAA